MTFQELLEIDDSAILNSDSEYLILSGKSLTDISGIEQFEKKALHINLNNNFIKDISPLRNFKKLRMLYLSNNLIEDITPLKNLTSLSSLSLNKNIISNIDILANLHELKTLYLEQLTISNLDFLNEKMNLERLVASSPYLKSIKGIATLNKLRTLSVWNIDSAFDDFEGGVNYQVIADNTTLREFNFVNRKKAHNSLLEALLKNKSLKWYNGLALSKIKTNLKYINNINNITKI